MADIDSIIAGISGNTRGDFSGLADIPKAYYEGQKQRAEKDLRESFKGGVPTLPDGSIDYATMQKTLYQKGALDQGNALSGISARAGELAALDRADGQAAPQTIVSPPSANRSASAVVAPPLNKGGVSQPSAPQASPGGDQPGSIVGAVSAAGVPDELAGPVIAQLSALAKIDPNATLPPEMAQRIQQVAQAAAQRMKTGQAPQPTGIQPQQAAPQAPPVMAQAQAAPQGFQPPPNVVAAQNDPYLKRLSLLAASQDKSIAESARIKLKDYQERTMPTQDMKNAAAAGMSLQDYQNRGDENKAQQAVLTDLILPELKTSKEVASAARTEIQSIHKAREQLDAPGGIFSGTGSEIRLKLAKAAELIGVPNTDKITNSEAFVSAMASKVAASLKALGTNPSNKDLVFSEKMAGSPAMNETSLRRILDIAEQTSRDKIGRHNSTVGQYTESTEAVKPYAKALRVDAPGPYQRPKGSQPAAGFPDAKQAPDGNFYVPDPARPGKYLRVVQ
jgi:hypothetical protein